MIAIGEIQVEVIRSARKTVAIQVERNGGVSVRAPTAASDDQVRRLVERRLPWLYKTLARWRELNRNTSQKELVSGETIYFLGQPYRLDFDAEASAPLALVGDRFVVRADKRAETEELLQGFYRAEGYARLPGIIGRHAKTMGVEVGKRRVWNLKNRWASCSPAGNLNFHWQSLSVSLDILEYLVVHELAHLKEPRHTSTFWKLVTDEYPGWKQAERWLADHGAQLTL